jgi:nucleoid DNA-binding protein
MENHMAKKTMAKSNGKAAASKPKKLSAAGKVRTKGEFFSTLAEQNMLTRKQVAGVFESMATLIAADLGKSGPGVVNVGGLMKVTVVRKPATKEREGINPFTKEKITIKAKPARNVIKVRPLKSLKGLV